MVPVSELTRLHLISEYKEITRLPANLRQSLNRKSSPFSMSEIPNQYTLGKGHVKYFFNKFGYLKRRFEMLVDEMLKRGYNPSYRDSSIFNVESKWMGDFEPTERDLEINRERIKERLNGS